MRPSNRELIPIATYSVTVRPDVWADSEVWAFNANWTSVISAKKNGHVVKLTTKKMYGSSNERKRTRIGFGCSSLHPERYARCEYSS